MLRLAIGASSQVPKMSLRGGSAAVAGRGPVGPVDVQHATVGELDGVEEAHVRTVPRQRAGDADLRAHLQDLRRDPVARELRDAVRFAHVFLRPAVLVDRVDVHVAVRILRLELGDRAGDADRLARVEVRREAVMRECVGCDEQCRDDSNP